MVVLDPENYKEGIRLAIKMGIRLVFLIIGASIMTLTTTPNQANRRSGAAASTTEQDPCAGT